MLGGASVNAWIQLPRVGYSYWAAHGKTLADLAGHFELTDLPESATVQLQVWTDKDVQQCASSAVTMVENGRQDIQLVSKALLSASPTSVPPSASGFRSISGRILHGGAGAAPAAGAFVDFEPVMDFPAAITFADADGEYLLCGIPDRISVWLCAGGGGQVGCVSVPPGQSTGVDITLSSIGN